MRSREDMTPTEVALLDLQARLEMLVSLTNCSCPFCGRHSYPIFPHSDDGKRDHPACYNCFKFEGWTYTNPLTQVTLP